MTADTRSPDPLALGVVLSGGRGERLGLGIPKAYVMLEGRTLFECAATAIMTACGWCVCLAPDEVGVPAKGVNGMSSYDHDPGLGPLAAIASVAARPDFVSRLDVPGVRIVTLAVDHPFVTSDVLFALLRHFDELAAGPEPPSALIPAPGGRPQPLVAVWSPGAFMALAAACAKGERAVTRACVGNGERLLDDEELARLGIAEAVSFDIDTPEDLAEAKRRLRAATPEPA